MSYEAEPLPLFAAESQKVAEAKSPEAALIGLLAAGLREAGFRVLDTKPRALAIKAGDHEIMIGVQVVGRPPRQKETE